MRFKRDLNLARDLNLIIIIDEIKFYNLFDEVDDKLRLDFINNLRVSNSTPIFRYDDLLYDLIEENNLDFEII